MIVRKNQAPTELKSSPGWGSVETARYADVGALKQFGAAVQTLMPGAKSSVRHWHEHVDEFLYVLSGEVTVTENDGHHLLHAGDAACWPAGVPNGHTVSNRSQAPCSYLIVGSRTASDVGVYVEDADLPAAT
jgi:uncharacterized cupin superfamily protein